MEVKKNKIMKKIIRKLKDLYDFVKYDMEENYDFYLFSTYPKVAYDDLSLSFEKVGITDMQNIFIHKF